MCIFFKNKIFTLNRKNEKKKNDLRYGYRFNGNKNEEPRTT